MLTFLSLTYFSLCCFDSWITRKRLISYGSNVEGNKVIRSLHLKMGPEIAAYVGIILPSIVITIILVALNWPIALGGLIGYRIRMFVNQLQSLQFEKEARRIKETINKSSQG